MSKNRAKLQQAVKIPQKKTKKATLKQLIKTWDAILAESGFQDIEFRDYLDNSSALPVFRYGGASSSLFKRYSPDTEHYYARAREFYNVYKFKSNLDKIIWYCHAEGLAIRQTKSAIDNKPLKYPYQDFKSPIKLKNTASLWTIHKILLALQQEFKVWRETQD